MLLFPATKTSIPVFGGTVEGFSSGGRVASLSRVDIIEKYSFSSDGNSSDTGDNLTVARGPACGGPDINGGHSYQQGGEDNSGITNVVDKWAMTSGSNATDVGNLTVSRQSAGSAVSTTHVFMAAGNPTSNVIDKTSFASGGNHTDVGDCSATFGHVGGCQDIAGGYAYVTIPTTTVDKYSMVSDGNGSDVGGSSDGRNGAGASAASTTHYYNGGSA